MLIQNNNKPLVALAILVMALCGVLGLLLGKDPFGPGQVVRAEAARTQLAMSVAATQAAMSAVQTPQALYVKQTVVAAELTAIPLNQTATVAAFNDTVGNAHIQATQTALANDGMAQQVAYQATQTAIVQQQALNTMAFNATATAFVQGPITEANHNNTELVIVGIGVLAISIWLVTHALIKALMARTEEKTADTQLLAEQRRLLSVRASIKAHQNKPHNENPQIQRTMPTSQIQKSGNDCSRPHAE